MSGYTSCVVLASDLQPEISASAAARGVGQGPTKTADEI